MQLLCFYSREEDISEELDNADASLIENDQQLPEPGPNVIHEADDLSLVGKYLPLFFNLIM